MTDVISTHLVLSSFVIEFDLIVLFLRIFIAVQQIKCITFFSEPFCIAWRRMEGESGRYLAGIHNHEGT